jgi:hypothetical protein
MLKEHFVFNFFKMLKIEYRRVIKLLSREGQSPEEIKKRPDNVYGDSAPTYTTIKKLDQRISAWHRTG